MEVAEGETVGKCEMIRGRSATGRFRQMKQARGGGPSCLDRHPGNSFPQADFLWKSRICSGVNLFSLTTRAFPSRNRGMASFASDSLRASTIA